MVGLGNKLTERFGKLEEFVTPQMSLRTSTKDRSGLRVFGIIHQIVHGIDLCVQPHFGIQNEILGKTNKCYSQCLFPPLV